MFVGAPQIFGGDSPTQDLFTGAIPDGVTPIPGTLKSVNVTAEVMAAAQKAVPSLSFPEFLLALLTMGNGDDAETKAPPGTASQSPVLLAGSAGSVLALSSGEPPPVDGTADSEQDDTPVDAAAPIQAVDAGPVWPVQNVVLPNLVQLAASIAAATAGSGPVTKLATGLPTLPSNEDGSGRLAARDHAQLAGLPQPVPASARSTVPGNSVIVPITGHSWSWKGDEDSNSTSQSPKVPAGSGTEETLASPPLQPQPQLSIHLPTGAPVNPIEPPRIPMTARQVHLPVSVDAATTLPSLAKQAQANTETAQLRRVQPVNEEASPPHNALAEVPRAIPMSNPPDAASTGGLPNPVSQIRLSDSANSTPQASAGPATIADTSAGQLEGRSPTLRTMDMAAREPVQPTAFSMLARPITNVLRTPRAESVMSKGTAGLGAIPTALPGECEAVVRNTPIGNIQNDGDEPVQPVEGEGGSDVIPSSAEFDSSGSSQPEEHTADGHLQQQWVARSKDETASDLAAERPTLRHESKSESLSATQPGQESSEADPRKEAQPGPELPGGVKGAATLHSSSNHVAIHGGSGENTAAANSTGAEPPNPPKTAASPGQFVPETPQPATPKHDLREIRLAIPRSGNREDVEVRLAERAGEVHVSVHAADASDRTTLRSHLQDLVHSMEQRGFTADVVRGNERSEAQTTVQSGSASQDMTDTNEEGRRQKHNWQPPEEQSNPRKQQQWLTTWEEISWQIRSRQQ